MKSFHVQQHGRNWRSLCEVTRAGPREMLSACSHSLGEIKKMMSWKNTGQRAPEMERGPNESPRVEERLRGFLSTGQPPGGDTARDDTARAEEYEIPHTKGLSEEVLGALRGPDATVTPARVLSSPTEPGKGQEWVKMQTRQTGLVFDQGAQRMRWLMGGRARTVNRGHTLLGQHFRA